MTGFLERWAELEPERCKTFPRHATVQVKGKWNPAEFTGTILAAVIEAITARGLKFYLKGGYSEPIRFVAHVGDAIDETSGVGNDPASALLDAYLSMLLLKAKTAAIFAPEDAR